MRHDGRTVGIRLRMLLEFLADGNASAVSQPDDTKERPRLDEWPWDWDFRRNRRYENRGRSLHRQGSKYSFCCSSSVGDLTYSSDSLLSDCLSEAGRSHSEALSSRESSPNNWPTQSKTASNFSRQPSPYRPESPYYEPTLTRGQSYPFATVDPSSVNMKRDITGDLGPTEEVVCNRSGDINSLIYLNESIVFSKDDIQLQGAEVVGTLDNYSAESISRFDNIRELSPEPQPQALPPLSSPGGIGHRSWDEIAAFYAKHAGGWKYDNSLPPTYLGDSFYKCKYQPCCYRSVHASSVNQHMQVQHGLAIPESPGPSATSKKIVTCQVCDKFRGRPSEVKYKSLILPVSIY